MPGIDKAQLKALQDFLGALKAAGIDATGAVKLNRVPVEAATGPMAGPASKAKAFTDELEARLFKWTDLAVRDRGKGPEQVAAEKATRDTTTAMQLLAGATFEASARLKEQEATDALSALTRAVKSFKEAGLAIDELGRFRAKLVELWETIQPPSERFAEQRNDMREMRAANGKNGFRFTDAQFALAGADLMRKFAPHGLEAKLPTAAEYGSQQAAELIARSNSLGGASAVSFLAQMLEVERQQLEQSRRMVEAFRNGQPGVIRLGPP